jgi:hypothetical protein
VQYFKHHTKMRHDVKIKRLISKYGLEGYGLYVLILETIAEEISTDKPLPELEETCDDIAEFYNCNSAKIDEIVRFMVEQGLFEVDIITKRLSCYKIYKYLEQSQTRSEKIRQLIEAYRDKTNQLQIPDLSETVCDKSDRLDKTKTRLEETKNRKEEGVTRHVYGKERNVKLTDDQFKHILDTYGQSNAMAMIDELSEYKAMTGRKYQRDDLAISKWVAKKVMDRVNLSKTKDLPPPPKEFLDNYESNYGSHT